MTEQVEEEGLKIVEMRTENIMRVKAVHLQLDEEAGLVVIGGDNDQGKTTVLNSFVFALGGARTIPDEPLRRGADKGEIEVKLVGDSGAEYNVTRTFTENDSYLTVEDANGRAYRSPQNLLDAFIGELSFDPLSFKNESASDQREMLLDAVGLSEEMQENQDKIDEVFSKRRDARKRVKRLEAKLEGKEKPDGPDELIDQGEILNELREARAKHKEAEELRREYNRADDAVEDEVEEFQDIQSEIETAADEIEELKARIKEYEEKKKELQKDAREQEETISAAEERAEEAAKSIPNDSDLPDIEAIEDKLESVEETNEKVRERRRIESLEGDLAEAKEAFDEKEKRLEALRQQRQEAVEASDMPLDGLSVTGDTVQYEGFPFDQLSSSKQLKVSLAVAAALNPELRALRVEDGSLLDRKSMEQVKEFAEKNDFHVWIERVGEDDTVSIVIEDGEVQ